jgi:hypothetical protein
MAGNPDGMLQLVSAKFPFDRIQYVPDATMETVRSIDRGILFVIAFWSGSAFRAYHELTAVITRLKAEEKLHLVVADIDGAEELMSLPEIGLLHGAGETAWIRSGKIVAFSGPGLNLDCFKPNTLSLLAMP